MNYQLLQKITDKYQVSVEERKKRDEVQVGDTVVAYVKVLVDLKYKKKLTAAEKQALKKALESGKTEEEIAQSKIKTQPFKGVVIAIKGSGIGRTITIRKIAANNIGVEKIIPLYSPVLDSIKIVKKGRPRRSKLYYLRQRVGKRALKVKQQEA